MKLLYTVILSMLMQIKSLESSKISLKDNLLKFHDNELKILSRNFCEKAKILAENILEDKIIQLAATTEIQEFKNDINDFLDIYPHYEHHQIYPELANLFENKIPAANSINQDSVYISELLSKLQYYEINEDYERKIILFVEKQFIPKFDELKAQLSRQESEQQQDFVNWFSEFRKCQNYDCYYKYWTKVLKNPKERLLQFIRAHLENLNLHYAHNINDILKEVLKDQRLSELRLEVEENLTANIGDIIQKLENNHNIDELNNIMQIFYTEIILKYYYAKDHQQLVKQIFDDHGYAKCDSVNQKKFNDFIENELQKKFDELKADLNPEESAKSKPVFQWFDQLKGLKTYAERISEFPKLYDIEYK